MLAGRVMVVGGRERERKEMVSPQDKFPDSSHSFAGPAFYRLYGYAVYGLGFGLRSSCEVLDFSRVR